MENKVQKALDLHESGYNCSQAVIGAFCEKFGLDEELGLKISGGFGGGLRCGEVCGAVSGAVMVIGLKYGQHNVDDKRAKEECYKITSEFMDEYVERNKSVVCRELLGYDIRDIEKITLIPGRQKEICAKAIVTAVLLLEEMGF